MSSSNDFWRKDEVFKLRVLPWWTDDCSNFLNNVFKWLPDILSRPLNALEFGGGNSTFYLLSKGLNVVTVESDDGYIDFICSVARNIGHTVLVTSPEEFQGEMINDFQLVLLKASSLLETGNILSGFQWDFVVNDGVSRREVLQEIHHKGIETIVILDNVEYCANWGRLDRTSAKPDLIKAYRSILRDKNWRHCIFEQPEGREGRGCADKTGWESPHRWISAVLWPDDNILTKLMVTNSGLPIVNSLGLKDLDTETLSSRCAYDWTEMKWLASSFPDELDLKLDRKFD